jgi:predicted DNA-binding transcriptional regulator YafY
VNTLQTYSVRAHANEGPRVRAEILMILAATCRDHERLRFDYESHGGGQTRRNVEPYRMVNWGRRWYLVAWDVDRDDWRTFRVDRMEPRTPTGPRFTPRELPEEVADRVMRGASSAAWRYRAKVTVHAPAEVVTERINPAVGTVEAVDAHTCVLDTGADSIETLAVYLGMLGVGFTVTEPAELVDYVRTLSERYRQAVA